MIDGKLLELLVCPVTKGKLKFDRKNSCFVSQQAKLVFPIIDGIPHMQLETALPLESLNLEDPSDQKSNSNDEE